MRYSAFALVAGLASAGLFGAATACTEYPAPAAHGSADGGEGIGAAPPTTAPLATGVTLEEVAVFQGSRVSVAQRGAKVMRRTMPVVAGRDALVRAYVKPSSAAARPITAELTLVRAGAVVATFKNTITVSRPSQEDTPSSTFNFDVPGAKLTADVGFMVRLLEQGAERVSTETENGAQYPSSGAIDTLDAQRVTDKLRVVLVPIRYAADGSNRLPDTSPAVVDALRKRMLEFYPVPDVEVTVRAPMDHSGAILPNGNGWDQVLQRVTQLRLTDNAPSDVYYYGAFAPAPSLSQFCANQCVLGLSNFGDTASDAAQHASIGALYPTARSIDTMPHEIGHAHGRMHAPCGGASGADPSYPYEGAHTGGWGYSIVTKALKPPTSFDQMSYCNPSWQSDYTYAGLFERLRTVQSMRVGGPAALGASSPSDGDDRAYRMLSVRPDGTIAWSGESFRTRQAIAGKPQRVAFVGDDDDDVLSESIAHAYTYDHLEGGYLIVPDDAPARASRLRIELGSHASALAAPMLSPVRQRFGSRADIVR